MDHDCAIIGGGLAGLTLSILMAKKGWNTLLFEKQQYPFHKVCGEYISLESKPFLQHLGIPVSPEQYPHISQLQVSSVRGTSINRPLDMGGFGISRYTLDHQLAQTAIANGVTIVHTRVDDIIPQKENYLINTSNGAFAAKACCGSFGKRSNLDIKWQRPFVQSKAYGLNNYLGIKYHIRYPQPKHLIALHNFKNGYCGISAIEDDKYCLCYLTSADNLKDNGNDIASMEKNVLQHNPHLKKIFTEAEFLYKEPLVISQVSFANKTQAIQGMPLLGDAAGLITPLCGNGMSMAMRASALLAPLLHQYLKGHISRAALNENYSRQWQQEFNRRLQTGRMVQRLFGNNILTECLVQSCRLFPFVADSLIRKTHGSPFGINPNE